MSLIKVGGATDFQRWFLLIFTCQTWRYLQLERDVTEIYKRDRQQGCWLTFSNPRPRQHQIDRYSPKMPVGMRTVRSDAGQAPPGDAAGLWGLSSHWFSVSNQTQCFAVLHSSSCRRWVCRKLEFSSTLLGDGWICSSPVSPTQQVPPWPPTLQAGSKRHGVLWAALQRGDFPSPGLEIIPVVFCKMWEGEQIPAGYYWPWGKCSGSQSACAHEMLPSPPALQCWAEDRSSARTQVVSWGLLPLCPSWQQGKTCLLQGTLLLPFVAGGQAAAD